MLITVAMYYQQVQPLSQKCGDLTLRHIWYSQGGNNMVARTRPLDMAKSGNGPLCFINDVAIERTIPAIIMSNSEYYQKYVMKYVGPGKQVKVNFLKKGDNVLMESYNGYVLRRFDFYAEEINRAIESIIVSIT